MIRLRHAGQGRLSSSCHPGLDPGSMNTVPAVGHGERRCSWIPTFVGMTMSVAAALLATPAFAETIAITGGRVVVGDGSEPIDGGTVVIRDGRVVAAGAGVAVPAGASVVDARGKWVTPGIFAITSYAGLVLQSDWIDRCTLAGPGPT